MRLIISEAGFDDELKDGVNVITIENRHAYTGVLSDLWKQFNGSDGEINLMIEDKRLKISTQTEFIFNPLDNDVNSKKILTKLYTELDLVSNDELYPELSELRSNIVNFLDQLIEKIPYDLTYDELFDLSALLKCVDLKVNQIDSSLPEKICDYIRIMHRLAGINVFIAANLKAYFTDLELSELYEFIEYENVILLIIEPLHTEKRMSEKSWIIDKDRCIIYEN